MIEERPVTPEKQLLKLIEDSKVKGDKTAGTYAIRHSSLSLFSPHAWMGRLSFFKDRLKKGIRGENIFLDIPTINNILIVLIVVLTAYFIISFSVSLMNLKKMPNLALQTQANATTVAAQGNSILKKAVAYYLDKVSQRDIFKMGARTVVAGTEKQLSPKIVEATKDLRLVGISWSDNPDAMIEDTKAVRTFFVKRGQMVGDLKVEAVFKDKVILSLNGEEFELK